MTCFELKSALRRIGICGLYLGEYDILLDHSLYMSHTFYSGRLPESEAVNSPEAVLTLLNFHSGSVFCTMLQVIA